MTGSACHGAPEASAFPVPRELCTGQERRQKVAEWRAWGLEKVWLLGILTCGVRSEVRPCLGNSTTYVEHKL